MWNQIRRIASSLHRVAKNDIELNEIALALEKPEESFDFGLAPADGLILWSLGHPEFPHNFEVPKIIDGISIPQKKKESSQAMVELGKNGK